jgi:NADPH2:quinone reductase
MKAIQFSRPGGPDVLQYVDLPTPSPGPGEVLIKAHAIGVSMPEVLVRKGAYPWMPPLPAVPGIEMSGTVAALGEGVTALVVDEPVFVSARELPDRGGCYAEYIAAPAERVYPLPLNIDLDHAAALSNYQVAWHLLHTATAGFNFESVLVLAAAGGVGSALVQLARLARKRVIAVASSQERLEFARSQGAQILIDRSAGDVAERVNAEGGVDLALDPAGGPEISRVFDCLRPFGTLILYGMLDGGLHPVALEGLSRPPQRSLSLRTFSMHTLDSDPARRAHATRELIRLLAERHIHPAIHERLPLAEARRAHQLLESGEVLGKLLLKP